MKITGAFLALSLFAVPAFAAPAPDELDDEPAPAVAELPPPVAELPPPPATIPPPAAQTPLELQLTPPGLRLDKTAQVRRDLRASSTSLFVIAGVNAAFAAVGGGLASARNLGCGDDFCIGPAVGYITLIAAGALSVGALVVGIVLEVVRARWHEVPRVASSGSGLAVRF